MKTITLPSLLKKYSIQHLDLFVMDVEGYEYHILKQLDLNQIRPKAFIFEYKNQSYMDCHRSIEKLIPFYTLYSTDFDILAIDSSLDSKFKESLNLPE